MKKTLCISILLFVLFANFAFGQQIAHLQQRYELLNWVNVRESPHGARGDGTTDDSIAFISACAAAINKILYVPPGTYKLSNDVTAGALVEVWFSNGVTLSVDNLKTFTISGKFHSPYIPTNIGLGTFDYSGATLPASPGGSDTQVQFNDGGITLGGDADLTWNKSTNVLTTTGVVKADSLKINDSDDTNTLEIKTTSNLTGDKALTVITGDADRSITLSGNPTLSDWFDQGVKQASSPTFAGLTLTNPLTLANGGSNKAITASANKLVYSDADSFELLDTGNSGVLVTSGAGVPSIGTDIPTAVTSGGKYIYRAEGTDIPVTDGGTGASDTTNARSNLGLGTIATLDSPLPTANGGAPATDRIDLKVYRPWADGGANSCIIADYHDNTNSINYTRETSASATQDYDLVYEFKIPTDFASFPADAFSVSVRNNDFAGNVMTATMYIAAGTADAGINGASIAPSASDVWQVITDTPTGTYAVGDACHIHIHLGNDEASNTVDVGRVFLTYNTR